MGIHRALDRERTAENIGEAAFDIGRGADQVFISKDSTSEFNEGATFGRLARSLGRTFAVREVMVPLNQIRYVGPGEEAEAAHIISESRYSVVPISEDGLFFGAAFYRESAGSKGCSRNQTASVSIADHIPDTTTLAEAFPLFSTREWYLCLRANRVSGLITYWAFNSREFRVLLFAALSRVEELSRDALAGDDKGVSDDSGLVFDGPLPKRLRKNFKKTLAKNGGNRFIDALGFSHISQALAHDDVWRQFLDHRLSGKINAQTYDEKYKFVDLRNAVMHGGTPFPDYEMFKRRGIDIENIWELIGHLEAYRDFQEARTEKPH